MLWCDFANDWDKVFPCCSLFHRAISIPAGCTFPIFPVYPATWDERVVGGRGIRHENRFTALQSEGRRGGNRGRRTREREGNMFTLKWEMGNADGLRSVPPLASVITLFRLSFSENLPCFLLTFRRGRHHLTQDMCEWKRAGDGGRETLEGRWWGGKDEREWL